MLLPNTPPLEMRSPGARQGMGLISTTVGTNGGGTLSPNTFIVGPGPSPAVSANGGGGGGGIAPVAPASPAQAAGMVNPVFFDVSGNLITHAVCGSIYSFTVPGYEGQVVHIVQTKNGAPSVSAPLKMPVPNYASKCNQDEGTYVVQAFTLVGDLLGGTTFNVLPAPAAPGGPMTPGAGLPPLPAATGTPAPAPGTTSATSPIPASSATAPLTATTTAPGFFSTLSTTDWLVIAVLAVVVLNQGKR